MIDGRARSDALRLADRRAARTTARRSRLPDDLAEFWHADARRAGASAARRSTASSRASSRSRPTTSRSAASAATRSEPGCTCPRSRCGRAAARRRAVPGIQRRSRPAPRARLLGDGRLRPPGGRHPRPGQRLDHRRHRRPGRLRPRPAGLPDPRHRGPARPTSTAVRTSTPYAPSRCCAATSSSTPRAWRSPAPARAAAWPSPSAALAPGAVAALLCDVPFLCDFRRAAAVARPSPTPSWSATWPPTATTSSTVFATLSYFDGAVLAPLATAPALSRSP